MIEKPLLLIQDFVPEFEKFYEVRTYWLNGKYSHSLGTTIDPTLGVSGFEKLNLHILKVNMMKNIFEHHDEEPEY